MRTGVVVHLSPTDRKRLRSIVDDRNSLQKHVWRARIVLATADGVGTVEIMRTAVRAECPLSGKRPTGKFDPKQTSSLSVFSLVEGCREIYCA